METTIQPAVLGIGQMGLVCASLLSTVDPGREVPETEVLLWGLNQEEAHELAQTRRSKRLEGFRLADSARVSIRDEDLSRANLIVSAIPVQHMREALRGLRPYLRPDAMVCSVSKGIETGTLMRPSQVISDVLDDPDGRPRPVGALSGPTIATELARCLPATMIAASEDASFALLLQRQFSTSWLRVYTNADLLGVEVSGATKNVIAIAAGIIDGLQAGFNAKSALLARGLAEIARLGEALGARPDTFFGIAGVGDLATTCFSPEGRNRSCGEALGRGVKLKDYLDRSPFVVEGVATTRAVLDLAQRFGVEMPITQAVHAVLFEGMDPLEGIQRLMRRELKAED
ncbi:MAG: NAD(P)-dependent glycerol-3-phosphate dehydrogenase [Phycisphaerales bacterium]|nr:NAD(P)-dependent glycerol-3-phosphate dehydrogenase [Phycisphaerales bacterium]